MSSRVIAFGVTVGLLPDGVGESTPGLTADGAHGALPLKKSGCDAEPVCQSCIKMTPGAHLGVGEYPGNVVPADSVAAGSTCLR